MAHLTMHAAFNNQVGLCVDTHVHRIRESSGGTSTSTPGAMDGFIACIDRQCFAMGFNAYT
eukprot:4709087-Amphidinium_carterae.1